ncbi:MAG: biotin/lipoyl-binding protein [Pseudomonadales bacterium]
MRLHLSEPFIGKLRNKRVVLITLGATVVMSALLVATAPHAAPEQPVEKAWPVTVMTVSPAAMQPSFTSFGRYETNRTAELSSDLPVRVAEVPVQEGQEVKAGEVVVRLDDGDLSRRVRELDAARSSARAALASARSELRLAQRTRGDFRLLHEAAQSKLARHRELLEKRLIAQTLFDDVANQAAEVSIRYQTQERLVEDLPNRITQAQADLTRAEAALEQAQQDLEETLVRAPFDGPVLAVETAGGEMNIPGRTLVRMSARGGFELRLEVPDRYSGRLQKYLAAGIEVQALTDDGLQFTLARLGRQVREGRSGVDAFFAPAPGAADAGIIGRVAQAWITLPAETDLVAVPVQALYENDRVYRIIDNRLNATPVERIGETSENGDYRILVRSPALTSGNTILATQLPQAVSGMLVAPIGDDA